MSGKRAEWKFLKNSKFLSVRNKQYYVKILPKRFRLNGKTIGFRLQIQKLQRQKSLHTTRPTGERGDNPDSVTLDETPKGIVAPP